MIEAGLLLVVLLQAAALVWRSVEDRKDRLHLTHLLVAKTPAEAALLDRTTFAHAEVAPPPRVREEKTLEWETVGAKPVGV